MATSYRMRMYRRQLWTRRYIIGGIAWGTIAATIVLALVLWT
jgi:hypothetical protein